MTVVLGAKERKALDHLSTLHREVVIKGKMPSGIGKITLEKLVDLGLAEAATSDRYYGELGWRITSNGWRCMYGKTYEEIMAMPDGSKAYPLRVWSWPPSDR